MFAPFFAPKRVPVRVCAAFSHAPGPRLHVHTRKKPAKLRYPFINPIKTIQNTAADLSLPTYATLNNGGEGSTRLSLIPPPRRTDTLNTSRSAPGHN